MGILKCTVFHVHMIKVLEQSKMIPKVPRKFGSSPQLCGGLPGAVVVVAGSSIYFVDE